MLRERLARDESSAAVAELHRRASTWFEQQGLAAEAIRHALAAGDAERAHEACRRHVELAKHRLIRALQVNQFQT